MILITVLMIITWIIFGILSGVIGTKRVGIGRGGGFALGFFLGIFGLIIVLSSKRAENRIKPLLLEAKYKASIKKYKEAEELYYKCLFLLKRDPEASYYYKPKGLYKKRWTDAIDYLRNEWEKKEHLKTR